MRALIGSIAVAAAGIAYAGTASKSTSFGDCVGTLPRGEQYALKISVKIDTTQKHRSYKAETTFDEPIRAGRTEPAVDTQAFQACLSKLLQ